jgi:hypothetical protein
MVGQADPRVASVEARQRRVGELAGVIETVGSEEDSLSTSSTQAWDVRSRKGIHPSRDSTTTGGSSCSIASRGIPQAAQSWFSRRNTRMPSSASST